MMLLSLAAAVVGLLATWGAMARFGQRPSPSGPVRYWLLGLGGLAPAWLIAFLGLLGPSPMGRAEGVLGASFLVSSAAALLGVIVTDGAVRRLRESGRDHAPLTYWLLGVAAIGPAWGAALLGLLWTRP